jgi:parallel beta-helix repeat protein
MSPLRILALSLSLAHSLLGADYVVSPSGSDKAAGSSTSPWLTLQHAVNSMSAGDTATAEPGIYLEKLTISKSGKSGSPITLRGKPGAVISGKGKDGANIVLIENQNHWIIANFEIRDNTRVKDGSGIRLEGSCSHITLRGNRVHEIRGRDAMGITVYGTDPSQPSTNLVIDGNEVFDCDPAKSEAITLNGNITEFSVINNRVHDVNNIGIDFIAGEAWVNGNSKAGTRNGVCKGNIVYRCRSNYGDGYAAGIYVDGAQNILIEGNTVTQCDIGIEVGAENKGQVTTSITVRNNTVFYNDKAGLVFGGYEKDAGRVQNSTFTGNTLYRNDRHKADRNGEIWIQWASGNQVTGNIVVTGDEAPLVNMDHGGVQNTINQNTYATTLGQEGAPFMLGGEDVEGLASWITATRQDRASTFGNGQVQLPTVE